MHTANSRTITIKQEEAIQQILQQINTQQHYTQNSRQTPELDIEIYELLKTQEKKIQQEYDLMAYQRHQKNRLAINMQAQFGDTKESSSSKKRNAQNYFSAGYLDFETLEVIKKYAEQETPKMLEIDNQSNFYNNYLEQTFNLRENRKGRSFQTNSSNESDENDEQNSIQIKIKSPKEIKVQKLPQSPQKINTEQSNYILDVFERQEMQKIKVRQEQIFQLDSSLPKINYMSTYKNQHQYEIFRFAQSSATKWFLRMKKPLSSITNAISFTANVSNGKNVDTIALHWQIFTIKDQIIMFVGDSWKQPLFITPQANRNIRKICVSPEKGYLAVALDTEVIIYSIKRESIVLLKHIADLKLTGISHLKFYDENPIRLCLVDNCESVALINIEQTLIFTRVKVQQIPHELFQVASLPNLKNQVSSKICDISIVNVNTVNAFEAVWNNLKKGQGGSFGNIGQAISGKINQKIKSNSKQINQTKQFFIALASQTRVCVYKIQPTIQLISMLKLSRSKYNNSNDKANVTVRWRKNDNLAKPQLLVASGRVVHIYKLVDDSQLPESSKNIPISSQQDILDDYQGKILKLHLIFHNHYDIIQMQVISDTHLLLKSSQNITVVAVPLIPSTNQVLIYQKINDSSFDEQSLEAICAESFESSLVFISAEKQVEMLSCTKQQIVYYIGGTKLIIAKLRNLQQELQDLMIQKGNFRQAFTLLILISKGLNFSFKFSYRQDDLKKQISAALQCALASILPKTQPSTIRFRVSWMIQTAVQCGLSSLIWSVIYEKLKDLSNESVLFDLLQIYLLKSQVRNIPQEVFYPLLKYHCRCYQDEDKSQRASQIEKLEKETKNKQAIAERIILDNPQSYDPMKVLSILHSKKLYYLQFYLFSRGIVCQQNDFYTPFLKVFSSFKQARKEIQKLNQGQISKGLTQKLVRSYQKSGLACFWFLRKCFFLQQIPTGKMTIDQRYQIVTNFLVQAMYKTIVGTLIQFDQKLFYETFLIPLMNGEFQKLIAQHNDQLIHQYISYNNEPLPFTNFLNVILHCVRQASIAYKQKFTNNSLKKSQESLNINHLVSKIRQKKQPQLSRKQAKRKQSFSLLSLTSLVNLDQQTSISIQLLQVEFQALAYSVGCNLSFENIIDILVIFFQNHTKEGKIHISEKLSLRPASFQAILIKLIDGIKPQLQKSSGATASQGKFYINKLLSFDDNPVSYILYRIDGNYKAAIQHFLRSKPKQQIFSFVSQIVQEIYKKYPPNQKITITDPSANIKQRKMNEIKQFLSRHISMLFQIDRGEALNVFYSLNFSTSQIYKLIEKSLTPKINFLTAVLQKFQHQDFDMKNQYLLEHLQQVCDLPKAEMLSYLDKFYYPLQQAIYICEQKGNFLAKAIFQERNGCPSQAFRSYERLIKNMVQINSSKTIESGQSLDSPNSNGKNKSPKRMRKQVQQCVSQLIRLCKQYSGVNSSNSNDKDNGNFWLRIIRLLSSYVQSNNNHKIYLKVEFQRLLQVVLDEMFSFLPTTLLIDFFIINTKDSSNDALELSLSRQLSIFQHLAYLVKFDLGMVNRVVKLSVLDLRDHRKIHAIKSRRGVQASEYCDFCKQTLESQCTQAKPCKIFFCKHAFHFICNQQNSKCLSCYYYSDNSIFEGAIDMVNKSCQKYPQKRRMSAEEVTRQRPKVDTNNIYVEHMSVAKFENRKKKFKLYDFEDYKSLMQTFNYNLYDK